MNFLTSLAQQILPQCELVLRILLAGILGCAIGFERKNRNKIAGVRTHAVVAFGAALMMVVSKYGFYDVADYDASRIAAQIVSGVGFLGAGIIFVRHNNSVSGLTTAAGIWATAGVGMAMGAGQYFIAVSGGMILVLLQVLLHKIGFLGRESYYANLKIIGDSKRVSVQQLEQYFLEKGIHITGLKVSKANREQTKIELELLLPPSCNKPDLISELAERKDIVSVKG